MLTIESLKERKQEVDDVTFFPRWKKNDPDESQTYLAHTMNVLSLPFSHHGFGVKDDGLVIKTWIAFGLERLKRVRQLGFVKHPFMMSLDGAIEEGLCFNHSRGNHVLDVMSVLTLMAFNNRTKLEREHPAALNLLRVAALTHDALTPAGGDTIKGIDPEAFDEDAAYYRLFAEMAGREERHALCRELGFNWPDAERTVIGHGLFGQLLDMADKISYVGRDTRQFLDYCKGSYERKGYFPEYQRIAQLVKEDPWICGWWESVRIDQDRAWVEDSERLGRFLELRLRMFRGLYYHGKRTMDIVLPVVVSGFLYKTGKLNRDKLLAMSDEQLENVIAEFCGVDHLDLRKVAPAEMKMESFATEREARDREKQYIILGHPFVHMENIRTPLKPSANKFYVRRGKLPEAFSTVFPKKAKELEELCVIDKPFRLCHFTETCLPSSHRKDLLRYRREQVGLDQA